MKLTNNLWNLLYPARCPVCDKIVSPSGANICFACRRKLRMIREPYCLKCGKPLQKEEQEYCLDCSSKKHIFISGTALYEYDSIQDSLYRFKYEGRQEYAAFFGEEMARYLGERIRKWNADALVPVPIHQRRMRERGYNQAQLLAEEIGARLGIPVRSRLVWRIRNTLPQKGLGPEERQNNLKKAFKICQNDVKLSTIVIIDDIYTTGSTVDDMAKLLMTSGIQKVYYVALAVGRGI